MKPNELDSKSNYKDADEISQRTESKYVDDLIVPSMNTIVYNLIQEFVGNGQRSVSRNQLRMKLSNVDLADIDYALDKLIECGMILKRDDDESYELK